MIFRYMRGFVYIFENLEENRVKVGMTINKPEDRLNNINDMWLERKVTCQICGGRFTDNLGLVQKHVSNGPFTRGVGGYCAGANKMPLEKEVLLAESHYENLKKILLELTGIEKNSVTRVINTLGNRIEKYRAYEDPIGRWKFGLAFNTDCAEQVGQPPFRSPGLIGNVPSLSFTHLSDHRLRENPAL